MHVYIPFSDFTKSAKCLSDKHLRANIKDAHQIINGKMENMPCSVMWMGATKALKIYFNAMLAELKSRGGKHRFDQYNVGGIVQMPLWMDNYRVHISHIVNLARKDYPHYSQWFNIPKLNYPSGYYWPYPNGVKTKEDTENWSAFFCFHPNAKELITSNV